MWKYFKIFKWISKYLIFKKPMLKKTLKVTFPELIKSYFYTHFYFSPLPLFFLISLGASLQSYSGQQRSKQALQGSKTTRQAYRSLGTQYPIHLWDKNKAEQNDFIYRNNQHRFLLKLLTTCWPSEHRNLISWFILFTS